jgi:transcriptional regulator with XRE-family HTH domain
MTPLSLAVRNAIERAGRTITDVAEELEMSRSALSNRLTSVNPLDPLSGKDQRLVIQIAELLKVSPESVFDEAEKIASQRGAYKNDPPDRYLVSLLLDTVANPDADPKQRDAARATIMRFMGLSP